MCKFQIYIHIRIKLFILEKLWIQFNVVMGYLWLPRKNKKIENNEKKRGNKKKLFLYVILNLFNLFLLKV